MNGLDEIPAGLRHTVAKHGLWPGQVQVAIRADLTNDGSFGDVWLVVGDGKIGFFSGQWEDQGQSGDQRWVETGYREIALADVEEVIPQTFAGSGALMVRVDGKDQVVCRYTNSAARKFGLFVKLLNKLRQGEELTESDFNEEELEMFCPKCGRPYPDSRKVCPHCLDKRSLFLRVLSFMPQYKHQIAIILTCMLLSSGLRLVSPYVSGRILFDEVLAPGGAYEGMVGPVVLVIMFSQLFALLISIVYGRVNAGMTARVIFDLKTRVFTALQMLSLSFFSNKQTGNLMTRVNQDAMHLQYFFHDGVPYFIVNMLNLVGVTIILFSMNTKLAALVLLPAPLIVYLMKTIFPRLWSIFSRRFRKSAALNALINDALSGVRVVKAFGKEETEVQRFGVRNNDLCSISMIAGSFVATVFPLLTFVMGLGGLIIWGYGGWQVVMSRMTFGTLMAFAGYMSMLYGPLEFMTHIVDWWSSCMNSAQRIFEILDASPEVTDAPDAVAMPDIKGHVSVRNVTFAYEPNKPVLKDISFDVAPGEMIGLVGHSGAGKSTITNLIARLYDVDEGSISIDGVDIRKIRLQDLHRQIGMVLQETFLFTGSIAENIAYAKPDASPEEIIRAAKAANAHDFIVKLPDGYDTVIGRRGHNLSGGERQRVAIARAILHNPRILILDEATASVDTETESKIQQALERLVEGRTTFAIAHRLSTLRNADRLVVLEQGKVAEIGTHEEVISKHGVYYNMLQKQREALKITGVGG